MVAANQNHDVLE